MSSSDVTLGIDYAKWQWGKPIPFAELKRRKVEFAIGKVVHGTSLDPYFRRGWDASHEAGMICGAYAWFLGDLDPIAQADAVVDSVELSNKDFGFSIDLEDTTTRYRGQALEDRCRAYAERIEDRSGREVMTYTGNWWYLQYLGIDSPFFAGRPLWLSEYPRIGVAPLDYERAARIIAKHVPRVPLPWAERGYRETIFQFDGDGGLTLPNGVDVDFNVFRGDYDDLVAFRDDNARDKRGRRIVPTLEAFVPTEGVPTPVPLDEQAWAATRQTLPAPTEKDRRWNSTVVASLFAQREKVEALATSVSRDTSLLSMLSRSGSSA